MTIFKDDATLQLAEKYIDNPALKEAVNDANAINASTEAHKQWAKIVLTERNNQLVVDMHIGYSTITLTIRNYFIYDGNKVSYGVTPPMGGQ